MELAELGREVARSEAHDMQSYRDYSPITVMMMSLLAVACRTLLPPVTVTVHVYVPSSWSARGLMVRLPV